MIYLRRTLGWLLRHNRFLFLRHVARYLTAALSSLGLANKPNRSEITFLETTGGLSALYGIEQNKVAQHGGCSNLTIPTRKSPQ